MSSRICGLVHRSDGKANKHNRLRCQLISSVHCSCCSLLLRSALPGSHVTAWYPGPGGRHEQRRHLRCAATIRPHQHRPGSAGPRCPPPFLHRRAAPRKLGNTFGNEPYRPPFAARRSGWSVTRRRPSRPSSTAPSSAVASRQLIQQPGSQARSRCAGLAGVRAFSVTHGHDDVRVN